MKKLIILSGLVLLGLAARAQQTPLLTQYMLNNFVYNPALAGTEGYVDLKASYRKQWVGISQSPTTYYASAHTALGRTPLSRKAVVPALGRSRGRSMGRDPINRFYSSRPHHGVGAIVLRDQYGIFNTTSLSLAYAYHQPLGQGLILSLGLQGGVAQYNGNVNDLRFEDPSDASARNNLSSLFPNAGAGFWLYNSRFYLGASADQLLRNKFKSANSAGSFGENVLRAHYYGTAGYRVPVTPEFYLVPSVMVRVLTPAPVGIDFNLKGTFQDRYWVGASFRRQDAIAGIIGMNVFRALDVSYSYDYTTSKLNVASRGSHEIVLGYRLSQRGSALCPSNFW
jgi:type IX secretion system PorP/SprF family membrane protein